MKSWRIVAGVLVVGIIVGALLVFLSLRHRQNQPVESGSKSEQSTTTPKLEPTPAAEKNETVQKKIPNSYIIDVPFTSQAPFALWDHLHEEACEEASLLMVRAAKKSTILGDAEAVDGAIKKLVDWETSNGYGEDVTVKQLQAIASSYFGLRGGKIIENPDVETLKQLIASGSLIIVPAAGRILPNPYFTPPGPNYHMLVLRGYDDGHFITNDPGTKRGEKLTYTYDQLLKAMHDFVPGDITQGKKRVLAY